MNTTLSSLVIETFSGIAATVLGVPGVAGGVVLSGVFKRYQEQKLFQAQSELLEAMRDAGLGHLEAADPDSAISVIYRYGVAARDGAARRNIRLMARCIAGLHRRDRLHPDEFAKYSEILARMTREQILVASIFLKTIRSERDFLSKTQGIPAEAIDTQVSGFETSLWRNASEQCREFGFSAREIMGLFGELAGLGLLATVNGHGEIVFMPTPKLEALGQLVELSSVSDSDIRNERADAHNPSL